jgi:phage gp45-like
VIGKRRTARGFADSVGKATGRVAGVLRKMIVQRSAGAVWRVLGFSQIDEATDAESYQGIGFASRPRAGAEAEAIVLHVGGRETPIVAATRDEGLRQQVAQLSEDETATFNSSSVAKHTAAGTFDVTAATAGVAQALLTAATAQAFMAILATAAPTDTSGALTILLKALNDAGWPSGATTVLRGQ